MAKNPTTSKIPRMDSGSKIPTFGAKFAKPVATALKPTTSHTVTGKSTRQTFYRSHSRDAIVTKRKSSLIQKTNFSSRGNLHKPVSANVMPVPDDEHMIIDDEPIELVGGSVETLSDMVDATYEVNGTFNVPQTPVARKDVTYLKGVAETPLAKPFDGTFDVTKSEERKNETFDVKSESERPKTLVKETRSRLSTDLAEQMMQKGLSPGPGLNSTINHTELLLNLTDKAISSPSQFLLEKPANVTTLLCLSNTEENNDSSENPLDKTLIASVESPAKENQDPALVVLRETNKGIIPAKQRFSLGLDISELQDCSIELCDMSNSSSMPGQNKSSSQNTGGKQSSFEMDESLGILTPEQMKEFLDSTKTNTASHPNHLPLQSHSAQEHKFGDRRHDCRVDLTPSPEELPLDPVGVKTDCIPDAALETDDTFPTTDMISSFADSDPNQMTKSAMSKISNSFIASITSVTSDGYQGDGEMSRPASRGADHSPINGIVSGQNRPPVSRRQDPMTDSDFFTESDADDNRGGDRRAQVIDGQLIGSHINVPVHPPPRGGTMDDSCMESSGVFTDVENRADEDMSHRALLPPLQPQQDVSPDTETQSSGNTQYTEKKRSSVLLMQTNVLINDVSEDNEHTQSNDNVVVVNAAATTEDNDNATKTRQSVVNRSTGDTPKQQQQTRKQVITLQRKLEMTPRSSSSGNKCKIQKLNSDEESVSSNTPRTRTKLKSNNKWDAVMNKIAENQKNASGKKKDLSEVKSKVYCGLTSVKVANGKLCAGTKRQLFITGKQGHAQDPEQSSQSDLSLESRSSVQSPKNQHKSSGSKSDTVIVTNPPHTIVHELKGSPPSKKHVTRKIADVTSKQLQQKQQQQDHNRTTVGNGPTTVAVAKQHINASPPKNRVSSSTNRVNLPVVTSKTPEPLTSPAHPHKITQRNATIILESATIIPSHTPTNNNNNTTTTTTNSTTKTSKSSSKKSSVISSPLSPNNKSVIGAAKNSNVNLKNLKNLSSKINATFVPPTTVDDGPSKAQLKQELCHANKGVEALGTLVQYLVYHLDAFSCPSIKLSHETSQKSLFETTRLLDETRAACQHLEARLEDRENYFKVRETELEKKYQEELNMTKQRMIELENSATSRIRSLETEISHKEASHLADVAKIRNDTELKVQAYETQLRTAKEHEQNLLSRVSELTSKVDELTEKAHSSEIEFSERIQSLTSQMEKLRTDAETREHQLLHELAVKKDDATVSRRVSPEKSMNGSLNRSTSALQDEVESLRCVLDLKQNEISELRKQNQEMQRAVDDHSALVMKHAAAESRLEDLQVQLQCKITQEQELLDKIKQLEESYNQEKKTKSRLSQHNEELQYRLKQNSEKFSATLSELSKSLHEHSMNQSHHKLHNGLDLSFRSQPSGEKPCFEIDEASSSPPTSPVIKGVVEKSDSVSWVLEMDDEAPEVLASRVVRRAGSFRSNYLSSEKCSQSPVPKRQKCHSPSPLQTSASATSVLRRNNSERSPQKEFSSSALRNRSKSVTIKSQTPAKKTGVAKNLSMSFQEPLRYTSSPRLDRHPESEFPEVFIEEASAFDPDQPAEFHRDKTPSFKQSRENRGLITCDTTKLLTNHSTEKKVRKPKIGAGEALISGSNSEDDTDTTDESCGLSSSSSGSNCDPREVLSIEDALMKKIATRVPIPSGSNTPMDVSWSEHITDENQDPVV